MNRRNIVIFLALIGMFVTYTQAFTTEVTEINTEFSDLSKYEGTEAFLSVYEAKPLGKHKVLGTLDITNRLGVTALAYVTIIPTNSSDMPIEAGAVTTFDYKIDSGGSWVTESYEDNSQIMASVDISLQSGSTRTLYVIFEKEDISTTIHLTSIIVQEKEST